MTDSALHDRMPGMEGAVRRNRSFAAAGGHANAGLFPAMRLLVLTCLDARLDPAHLFGLELGDALVVRNNGGRVTAQVIDELAYVSQLAEAGRPEGELFEIAIVQHTECGASRLADPAFRSRYAERIGADDSELLERALVRLPDTVKADVERLRAAGTISSRVTVSGHVYDVATGLIETVVAADPVGSMP
jgi:carbonic anhydrase